MGKPLTKVELETLLKQESDVWGKRMEQYQAEGDVVMAEQALGRQLEAEWIYTIFSGNEALPEEKPQAKKTAAKKTAVKAPAAKKPAAKAAPAKKPAAKKA